MSQSILFVLAHQYISQDFKSRRRQCGMFELTAELVSTELKRPETVEQPYRRRDCACAWDRGMGVFDVC